MMAQRIIAACVKFRLLILALAIAVIAIGAIQLVNMPVDILPEFAPVFIEVQTEAPGLSDSEVEQFITFYLEGLLNGTPWLRAIQSTSVPGLSSITLTFMPGTDIMRARQLVSERLSLAYSLPTIALPPVILQPLSAFSQVMMIGLTSKQVSLMQMSVLAHWDIRPALLSVPGVANVAIWGMRDQQLQVDVDPEKLQANHVPMEAIVATVGNALWVSPLSYLKASTPGSGGFIETPQQRIEIRHVLPISSAAALARINIEGHTQQISAIGTVVNGFQPLIGDAIINGDSGLLLVVEKFPGANTLAITSAVQAKLAELAPGLPGIKINTDLFQPARFIHNTLRNFSSLVAIGFLNIFILILLWMRSWRAAIITLAALVISIISAILILSVLDVTLNVVLLSGLLMAIVILVDDAILGLMHFRAGVISENYGTATGYATLIVLLAVAPIMFLNTSIQAFLATLSISYVLAILSSLFVGVSVTPALAAIFFSKASQKNPEFFYLQNLQHTYQALLDKIIKTRSSSMFTIIAIIIGVLGFVSLALFIFFKPPPLLAKFREPNILIQWEGPPATSITEMQRILTTASQELRATPGVANVAVEIGRAVLGSHLVDVNAAEMVVTLKSDANYAATSAAIDNIIHGYPGLYHTSQTYLQAKTQKVLTGTEAGDVIVRIFGTDFAVLRDKAEAIRRRLATLPGISNIHVEAQTLEPEIAVTVDLDKAQHYGLKPGDVRRAEATWISGIETSSLFQDQKIFPVEVWGIPATRSSLESIQNLPIDTPNQQYLRLKDIAQVNLMPTPNLIKHENVSRRIDVIIDANGRNMSTLVYDIKQQLKQLQLPLEYHIEMRGAYKEQNFLHANLVWIGLALVIFIFLLLEAAFNSFSLALAILLAMPFALSGSVLAIFILNDQLSLIPIFALLSILCIAVRNAIALIQCYQKSTSLTQQTLTEQVCHVAAERFSAVLVTAMAASAFMLPLVVLSNKSGLEIASPTAIILVAGFISSTLFSLFMLPLLYLRYAHKNLSTLNKKEAI